MEVRFEWDPDKAAENVEKHGVSFDEARTVFSDPLSRTVFDDLHSSGGEDRWLTIGHSSRGVTTVVSHEDHGRTIRLISARRATPAERADYEETY